MNKVTKLPPRWALDYWYDVEVRPSPPNAVCVVIVRRHSDGSVSAVSDFGEPWANRWAFIRPPNQLERMVGLTWDKKIERKVVELREHAAGLNEKFCYVKHQAMKWTR